MTLEELKAALDAGTFDFRDIRFTNAGDSSALQNIRLPGHSVTFERCLFETGLDLRGCRLDSLRFLDCVFFQQPKWNPDGQCSLDLRNSALDGLMLDIIPQQTKRDVPSEVDGNDNDAGDFQPCLSVILDRAIIRQSAQFQVTTLFDGSSAWLGDREPDTLWGKPDPEPILNQEDAPILVVSAYQARIEHDLGISVACHPRSRNVLRAVALLAPDIDVMGSLTIVGSNDDGDADPLRLNVSCNLELARVRDQLLLSGVRLACRASDPQERRVPALSLVGGRIGSFMLDNISPGGDGRRGFLPVTDKAENPSSSEVFLPFHLVRFNITGRGVLANLRLDEAIVQFRERQQAGKGALDYPARNAELWEALADHDEILPGERALVRLHHALDAGGARSAPEVLKEHIQKKRRIRDFARHWNDGRKMLARAVAVTAMLAVASVLLTTDWIYGAVRGRLPEALAETPLYAVFMVMALLLAIASGIWRGRRTGFRTWNAIPGHARWAGLILVLVALALAAITPVTGKWSGLNSFFMYLLFFASTYFMVSRKGRHMIMQAVENLGQSWMTRIVSDGKRPLSVLSVLLVVWAGLSTMYFTAANRGYMAPEEIEAFHLEPWYAQTDALRLRLDDCAGGNCRASSTEAEDAAMIAALYLESAVRPPDPRDPNAPPPATDAEIRILARIPGFAYFSACRINWVSIEEPLEETWVTTVVSYSGIDPTIYGRGEHGFRSIVAKLDPKKVCAWYLPAEYSAFQPFLYAADVVIPLLNLRQEEEWSIRVLDPLTGDELREAHVFLVLESLATLIGWLCVLILVSELTGLSNPNRRFR